MPRLWTDTIETHRREVRAAILETAADLVAEHGILGVTMSQIAETAGIGRATLYKYFTDVESILAAWHEHHIEQHVAQLRAASEDRAEPSERLTAVLERFAFIQHERRVHHATELAAHLHGGEHVVQAERELRSLIRSVLDEAAHTGHIRGDVTVDELVPYCIRAVSAAADLSSKAAVRRLVRVVTDGLRGMGR